MSGASTEEGGGTMPGAGGRCADALPRPAPPPRPQGGYAKKQVET